MDLLWKHLGVFLLLLQMHQDINEDAELHVIVCKVELAFGLVEVCTLSAFLILNMVNPITVFDLIPTYILINKVNQGVQTI